MKINGLLGKKLSHSFSPAVHLAFGTPNYRLYETDNVSQFLKNERFSAINVTIPYKKSILPLLDSLDESSQKTGAVNLVVRTEQGLRGYNTDYEGMTQAFLWSGVSLKGKKLFIFGNGGAAETVAVLAKDLGCIAVDKAARHPKTGEYSLPLDSSKVFDHQILINATPVGMYPDNESKLPVDPAAFPQAEAFFDLIYNPLSTRTMMSFRSAGVPSYNGLFLLVAQAKRTHEMISGRSIENQKTESVYRSLAVKACNLVLIGLPLSGKTLYSTPLAERFRKIPVDTDALIERKTQMPVSEIFRIHGEPFFRNLENEVVEELYRAGNQVIATGGGMIENPDLMEKLRQNGILIFLDKDPGEIAQLRAENRPLIQSPEDVLRLSQRRRPLYQKYADITLDVHRSIEENLEEIEAKLHEYFSH